jgi:phosphoglycerol transferase MdoB-like AlkP superfamily enzyme
MVTALLGIIPKKYHRICYAEREKEVSYQIFYLTYPVNFGMGNLVAVIGPLVTIGLAWWAWNTVHSLILIVLLGIVGIWPLALRLFVYWKWERSLSSLPIR